MANNNQDNENFKGEFNNIYEVNRKFPMGGKSGQYVMIDGWAHYWNADRGTWCVNEKRDSYWDELITGLSQKIDDLKAELSTKIDELVIGTNRLVDGAVTTIKLAYGAVTTEKLADAAVTSDKLADDVWQTMQEKFHVDAMTNPDIDAVTDGSFDGGKIDLCGCTEIPDDYVSSLP